jgi:AraC-like DNA-binding protein
MPGSATGQFIDADDYQKSLRGFAMELVVTQTGDFHAELTCASVANFRLISARETLARVAYIALPATFVCVSFSTRGDAPLFWNGIELRPGGIVLHSRGERMHQRTAWPSQWGILAIAPTFFARKGSAIAGYQLEAPPAGRIVRPPKRDLARLLGLHARIAHLVRTRPIAIGQPEIDRALEDEILYTLVACLGSRNVDAGQETDQHHRHIMEQFEAVLTAAPERRLHFKEICAMIGVTGQNLRTCCHAFLGVSPSRYLLLRRLKLVRTAMLNADPATVRIEDVCGHYGFSAPGYFAAAYRGAFGENPSVMLARLRNIRQ